MEHFLKGKVPFLMSDDFMEICYKWSKRVCPLKYSFLILFLLVHVSTRNSDSHIHKKLLINGTKKAWIYLQCNFALVIFKISEHEWTYIMYIIIQIQSSMFIFPCIRTLIYYNSAQSNFDIYIYRLLILKLYNNVF